MNKELIKKIRDAINDITDELDRAFDPSHYDGAFDFDHDEVLRSFKDNYNSRSIGVTDFDDLDASEIISKMKLSLKTETIVNIILAHTEIIEADYYTQYNEVYSIQVGETEYQLDVCDYDELETLIAEATDEELKEAGADRDSFCSYGEPCVRVIWKLDAEAFLSDLIVTAALKRSMLRLA
jgi:hypothetical protein